MLAALFKDFDALILKQGKSEILLVEQVVNYLFYNKGKRVRPHLIYLIALLNKPKNFTKHTKLAVALELIHNATLLHDDVVDDSLLRRGQKTAKEVYGNSASVLVGDFLYTRSFQLLASIEDLYILQAMAKATNIIAEGEVLQLANIGNINISVETYEKIIYSKTACLFEVACELSAYLCAISDDFQKQAKLIGYHLGMGFQLIDDYLDYIGNSEELGKNLGDDLMEKKMTLPLILAHQSLMQEKNNLIEQILTSDQPLDFLDDLLKALKSTDALNKTLKSAKKHTDKALNILNTFEDSQEKSTLQQMIFKLLERVA